MKTAFFLLLASIILSGTGVFMHRWGYWLAVFYVVTCLGMAIYWWPESTSVPQPSKPIELKI